jgi:hypothetical protein
MHSVMGEALIFPEKGNDPSIGPVAVMAAMEGDVALVRRLMGFTGPRMGKSGRLFVNKSLPGYSFFYLFTHGRPDIHLQPSLA